LQQATPFETSIGCRMGSGHRPRDVTWYAPRLRRHHGRSPERRWSSRRFPYGYLVTTSPQSPDIPWAAASLAG